MESGEPAVSVRSGRYVRQPMGYRAFIPAPLPPSPPIGTSGELQTLDHGDWEGWLAFFLRGVEQVSHEATETVRRVLQMRERHRAVITEHLGRAAHNALRVHGTSFHRPIVTVNAVQELTGTSYPAANDLVAKLCRHGVLREMTGYSRNRRFRHEEYVRLFAGEEIVEG